MTASTLSADTLKVVSKVFPLEFTKTLSPQQRGSLNVMIQRIRDKDGEAALTEPRLEGVKEMLTEHLYFPPTKQVTGTE